MFPSLLGVTVPTDRVVADNAAMTGSWKELCLLTRMRPAIYGREGCIFEMSRIWNDIWTWGFAGLELHALHQKCAERWTNGRPEHVRGLSSPRIGIRFELEAGTQSQSACVSKSVGGVTVPTDQVRMQSGDLRLGRLHIRDESNLDDIWIWGLQASSWTLCTASTRSVLGDERTPRACERG